MRLFVALELPEHVRAAFSDLIARLKLESPKARWVSPEANATSRLNSLVRPIPENLDAIRAALMQTVPFQRTRGNESSR